SSGCRHARMGGRTADQKSLPAARPWSRIFAARFRNCWVFRTDIFYPLPPVGKYGLRSPVGELPGAGHRDRLTAARGQTLMVINGLKGELFRRWRRCRPAIVRPAL